MSDAAASAARKPILQSVAAWFAGLTGWRRWGLAFAGGALATLALPPAHVLPAIYLAFPMLVWMLAGTRGWRSAFGLGWWFGFGFFAAGLYWIGNALLIFAAKHAWMIPFASLGLPAFLAIFTGVAAVAASFGRGHTERALALSVAWVGAEWLRGHILTGFPWNLTGHSWVGSDALLQTASVVGIYGVSLIAIASACLLAALAESGKRRWIGCVAAAVLLAGPWAGGMARLASVPAPGEAVVPGIGLRLVQAGIPQQEKWRRSLRQRNLDRHLQLSRDNRPDWVTHIIWPENAATFFVEDQRLERMAVASVVPPGGLVITGAPRRETNPLRIWNSMFAVDGSGAVVGQYDKAHLVPFGEYVPLRNFLPIAKITQGAVDYSAGPGPKTVRLPGLPAMSPLICYEVIFPGAVIDRADRPSWLLNLTNDAWYGLTAGPYQHLAIARVRAVEEGMPLIRSANTGISAVVDSHGRVLARLGLREKGVLDVRLPATVGQKTLYARYYDMLFLALWLLACVVLVFLNRLRG